MLKIEDSLTCRKRNSTRTFKNTTEGFLANRSRVILAFFITGYLATLLVTGVSDVYGAGGISIPVRVDYGSVPVGGIPSEKSFTIKNTGKNSFYIFDIPKWAPPDYQWWTIVPDRPGSCYKDQRIDPNGSCNLTYKFSPPAVNSYDYTLNIRYTYDYKTVNNANTHFYGTGVKGSPNIIWPIPEGIIYGTALGPAQLNATAKDANGLEIPGSYVYNPPAGTVLNAGSHPLSVTFTPTDTVNYNTATRNTSIVVSKATPSVTTWPTASGITYGQALLASTLSGGGASVPGSFAFTTPSTTPDVGTYSASVTFTPTDTTNYNTVTGSVDVVVSKATPSVTIWPTASGITYGQALSASTLSGGSASVLGSFAFTTPSTMPDAGTYSASVTFTPADTNHYDTVTGTVGVTVEKATPSVITWPTASGITYGQALSASTLSGGTEPVPGSFAFTTPSTMPDAGTYSASVTFTPTDTANYNIVTGSVNVAVSKASGTVTLSKMTQTYTGNPLTPTATTDPPDLAIVWTGAPQTNVGTYSVTAMIGNPNYQGSASGTFVILLVLVTKSKTQIGESLFCTDFDESTGCPKIMYRCPIGSDCATCYSQANECGNSSLSDVAFLPQDLVWIGQGADNPGCETAYFITSNITYRCIEGIDYCFTCGSNSGTGNLNSHIGTPPVIMTTQQKIDTVWMCAESPNETTGCFQTIYSCPNATDTNPCGCSNVTRIPWNYPLPLSGVTFAAGTLQYIGMSPDNIDCNTVFFVTTQCIYKCILGTNKCFTYGANCPSIPPQ